MEEGGSRRAGRDVDGGRTGGMTLGFIHGGVGIS